MMSDRKYGQLNENKLFSQIILEQDSSFEGETAGTNAISNTRPNIAKSIEDRIDDGEKSKRDKQQAYRVSGGVIVVHGKNTQDLQLTTEDKAAFQETMDEFVTEVSDLADFNTLNVYANNVEWSGKLIDGDLDFIFTIGEDSGIYINGQIIKVDDEFLDLINKLKKYYQKFKSKWGKVLANRKKTKESPE
jgi:hypothetical protein